MSGAYYFKYGLSPEEGSEFCYINGVISMMSITGDILYNIAFIFSPLMLVSNTLSKKVKNHKLIHVVIILCMVIVAIISV